ncbi:hypothetical protein HPB49_001235 [Dermacentor silvarum]|uniref:Uncharacterized protein n=1 Tax=Dermacentor silvarum TaxID=543639 RepID=A0ACB8CJ36_DERSI|nr:hypothetical protein HPB49_001235 [Dermacentor silvarum]
MHPDRYIGQRQARAQALARFFRDDTSDTPVLYTDVARYPQRRAVCLVVLDSTDTLRASAALNTVDSGPAEVAAIALAIVRASTIPAPDGPITVVTDSQTACRTLAQGMVTPYTHRILTSLQTTALHRVRQRPVCHTTTTAFNTEPAAEITQTALNNARLVRA